MLDTLRLCHLYPKEMNTYADRGNIIVLKGRLEWRGMKLEITELGQGEKLSAQVAKKIDLVYMGGGQDLEQAQISDDIVKLKAPALQEILLGDNKAVGLFVCGGYQLAGHAYATSTKTLYGMGVLGITTIQSDKKRLVGDIQITATLENKELNIIGYENHAGRTHILSNSEHLPSASTPLGTVVSGYGNNGTDGTEGAITGRTIGTYIHGPLLPKNPALADLLISWGLEHRYGTTPDLSPLDDSFSELAR